MSATTQRVAPILARWVCVADTKLKMSWQFVSARADIYQIFQSAYVEIYYGMRVHTQKKTDTTHIRKKRENTHYSFTIRYTPSSSAHASYKGYGCNNAKPPWPPHRNTIIHVVVLGCGPIQMGERAAAPFIGVHILAKFGWRGGLIPWPNRDWRTELDRLSRSKNQPYQNQPSGASLCSANRPWDGTAALFVATDIGGNIQRLRGVEGMANW